MSGPDTVRWLALSLLLLPLTSGAQIYRCIQADGGTLFTSVPCADQGLNEAGVMHEDDLQQRHSTFDGAGLLRQAQQAAPAQAASETPAPPAPGRAHSRADYCQLLQQTLDDSRSRLGVAGAAQREQLLRRLQLLQATQQRHGCTATVVHSEPQVVAP